MILKAANHFQSRQITCKFANVETSTREPTIDEYIAKTSLEEELENIQKNITYNMEINQKNIQRSNKLETDIKKCEDSIYRFSGRVGATHLYGTGLSVVENIVKSNTKKLHKLRKQLSDLHDTMRDVINKIEQLQQRQNDKKRELMSHEAL
ncbi:hypothetical protein RF11_01598 [Thelohanellus kitauei]|uniref:Uncharacterized protein n=1 Tax=Thelohanellus kitauei TaxID=669202 RepID=A0A0C2MWJ9_THEKT|nr:hypothetical protein RF11_01598 [Thelohanellus kitauei]